jgi:hypothetical protein
MTQAGGESSRQVADRAAKGMQVTAGKAIRGFCLGCVGASKARAAFDCLSQICLLYAASPFWHKPLPATLRPPDYDGEPEIPRPTRRHPSRSLIRAYCRTCQPGDRTDCGGDWCALYPYRPWPGPGKAPKRQATERQRAAGFQGRPSQEPSEPAPEGQFEAKDRR